MEDLQRVIEDCFGAEVYNKIPKDYWELETEEDCKKLSDYLSQYLDDSKKSLFILINFSQTNLCLRPNLQAFESMEDFYEVWIF